MSFQVSTNKQFASPSAANAASVAAAGVAWTNTAWVQIAATTDVVWVLTSVIVWTVSANFPSGATTDFEVDIGTGGAGSEVVLTTVRGRHKSTGLALYSQPIRVPIPIDNLNGRHAFRLRTSDTRTDTWNVAVTYLKNPVNGTLLITRSPGLVAPAAATPITVTASGSAWASGAWAQVIASTATDIIVTHAVLQPSASGVQIEIDIGVGAAAAEVVVTTIRLGASSQSSPCVMELPNPLDNIPAGSRVSFRARCSTGSTTCASALMYQAKPI